MLNPGILFRIPRSAFALFRVRFESYGIVTLLALTENGAWEYDPFPDSEELNKEDVMIATRKLIRPIILISSIALVGGYIWYNASQASRSPEHPEPVAEHKSEPVRVDAPLAGKENTAPNNSATTIMPGSKFIVLPGSKSAGIDTSVLDIPQVIPLEAQQKPTEAPAPEGKK